MPTISNSSKSNKKSVAPELDRLLVRHLLSEESTLGLKYLVEHGIIVPKDSKELKSIRNRFQFLKNLQETNGKSFRELCVHHKLVEGIKVTEDPTAEEEDFESLFQEEVNPKPAVSKPFAKAPKAAKMIENKMGESIVLKLSSGSYFIILWVDQPLNRNNLQIIIDNNGMELIKRTKQPQDRFASKFCKEMGYGWADDPYNVVVSALDEEFNRLDSESEKWHKETLFVFDEKVFTYVTDLNGNPAKINSSKDEDGRQRLSFFVKTVSSQIKKSTAAEYANATACPPRVD